jgi:hypothetical protein
MYISFNLKLIQCFQEKERDHVHTIGYLFIIYVFNEYAMYN